MSDTANQKRNISAECDAFRDMALGWKNSILDK